MFGDHGLGGLLEEGAHGKSPKCLGGNLGDFEEFCKGLRPSENDFQTAFLYFGANLIHFSQIRLQSLAEDFHIGNFSDIGFAQVFQTDKTHDAAADFFVVAHVFNPFFK